jgi:Na+-driven multidrug efflux pump
VEYTALAGVGINVVLTGSLVVLAYLAERPLVETFLPNAPHAVAIAERINAFVLWSFIPFGVMFVLFGVVRATGAVMPPLVILAISLLGVRVGSAQILEPYIGETAIWASFPAAMLVACTLAILYYRYGGWRRAHMLPEPA